MVDETRTGVRYVGKRLTEKTETLNKHNMAACSEPPTDQA